MNIVKNLSSNTEFRILIINSSGNSGKTSANRGFVLYRLNNPSCFRVSYKGTEKLKGEEAISIGYFSEIHRELMSVNSAIVEVEVSICENFIEKMKQMHHCHEDYDFILVPVINSSIKLVQDSIRTIETLLDLDVERSKIKVLFNRVSDSNELFQPLVDVLDKLDIDYNLEAQIKSYEYYETLEKLDLDYNDITESRLKDDLNYLNLLKQRRSKYQLSENELEMMTKLVQSVTAQRKVLAYKEMEDKTFQLLFDSFNNAASA